jgi:hypothetical protein
VRAGDAREDRVTEPGTTSRPVGASAMVVRMPRDPDSLPSLEPIEPMTRLEKPRRTVVSDSLDVAVDDLPSPPAGGTPRDARRELRELVDLLCCRLRGVEAQVVSLARELADPSRRGADDDRARALVTSSVEAVRAGLRAVDRCEQWLGLERRSRPVTPIPAS